MISASLCCATACGARKDLDVQAGLRRPQNRRDRGTSVPSVQLTVLRSRREKSGAEKTIGLLPAAMREHLVDVSRESKFEPPMSAPLPPLTSPPRAIPPRTAATC
jgi:hypothetical protein